MSAVRGRAGEHRKGGGPWWVPWPVVALVVVTAANYTGQVPYYLHFYGRFGNSPGGLTFPLLLTFVWFLVGTVLLVTRRRGGVPVMASFLVVEALFYLVHNVSGAAGRDLLTGDAVLLVVSLMGYLNAVAAVLFLGWLFLTRRRTRAVNRAATRSHGGGPFPVRCGRGFLPPVVRREDTAMLPEERFEVLVREFAGGPGVSVPGERGRRGFGSSALKINGAIFAMISSGKLVVKLPHDRVTTLLGTGAGTPFDAGKGRPMKEWVTVTADDGESWLPLAREARDFVGSAHR